MTNVAVIMPSKGRAAQLRRNATGLLMQLPPKGVDLSLLLAVIWNDEPTVNVARDLAATWQDSDVTVGIVYREPNTTCVQGFNQGYLALRGTADWVVLGSDDQVYQPGWLAAALKVADETGAQVIGLNDGHTNIDDYAPHYMMAGRFITERLGGLMVPPAYRSWWFDREVCEIARWAGVYAPAWLAHVEHQHPDWGTAAMDDTYREMWPAHDVDRQLYIDRRRGSYPIDWTVEHAS